MKSLTAERPLRVVVSKVGLDGHDRGIKIVARALKDAGFEVIYTGLHQTPENVVEAAIQEDADLIGVSMLSAAHMTIFPKMLDLLKKRGATRIGLFGGGVIPDKEIAALQGQGVLKLFGPGTSLSEIVAWCRAYKPATSAKTPKPAAKRSSSPPAKKKPARKR